MQHSDMVTTSPFPNIRLHTFINSLKAHCFHFNLNLTPNWTYPFASLLFVLSWLSVKSANTKDDSFKGNSLTKYPVLEIHECLMITSKLCLTQSGWGTPPPREAGGWREPTETVCVAGVGNGDGMGRERRGRAGSDELAPGISQWRCVWASHPHHPRRETATRVNIQ